MLRVIERAMVWVSRGSATDPPTGQPKARCWWVQVIYHHERKKQQKATKAIIATTRNTQKLGDFDEKWKSLTLLLIRSDEGHGGTVPSSHGPNWTLDEIINDLQGTTTIALICSTNQLGNLNVDMEKMLSYRKSSRVDVWYHNGRGSQGHHGDIVEP